MVCNNNLWDLDSRYIRETVSGFEDNWYCYAKSPGICYSALSADTKNLFIELDKMVSYICMIDEEMYVYPRPAVLRSYSDMQSLMKKSLKIMVDIQDAYSFWKRIENTILNDPVPQQRINAVNVLAHAIAGGDLKKEKRSVLSKALNDNDISIQIAAAWHLGYIGKQYLKKLVKKKLKILIVPCRLVLLNSFLRTGKE